MMKSQFLVAPLALACILLPTNVDAAALTSTTFTYQGQLKQGGVPADGFFDFQFTLFEANAIVAGPICFDEVEVVNGLFRVELDFGDIFNGNARELRVAVRPGGFPANCNLIQAVNYVNLTPRQPITPTPYAIHALSAPNGNALDAADGAPANAVFVDNDGRVGIHNVAPVRTVDVFDAISTLRLTGITPNAPGGVIDLKHLQPQGSIPGATNSPGSIRFVDNADTVMGSIDMIGLLNLPSPNPPIPPRLVISSSNLTMDSTGQFLVAADGGVDINGAGQVDVESSGSNIRLRTGGATNVFVSSAGNVGIGSSAPTAKLHVVGTALVTGNVSVTAPAGDAALDLPDNAISSGEILNEPGIASDIASNAIVISGDAFTTLLSRDITVPTSGHVIAIATILARAGISLETASVTYNIRRTTSTNLAESCGGQIPATEDEVVTCHGVFPVSAGTNSFDVIGMSGRNDSTVFGRRLTLIFVPTTYGTTDPSPPQPNEPMLLGTLQSPDDKTTMDERVLDHESPSADEHESAASIGEREARNAELEQRVARLEAIIRSMAESKSP